MSGLFEAWIAWRQSPECPKDKLQQSSEHEYLTRFKTHIQPVLGKTKIRKVDRAMLQHFIWVSIPAKKKQVKDESGKWVDSEAPAVSVYLQKQIYSVLSSMFTFAVEERELLKVNPLERVARPKTGGVSGERKKELVDHHYLPRRVTKALHGTPELGYWILLFIGLRTSERLGITLSSFRNLENLDKPATLTINQQLVRDRKTGKWFLKPHTKTGAGERVLILPEFFREHLILWKKQRSQWRKDGIKNGTWAPEEGLEQLFFVMPEGTSMRQNTDRQRWAVLLEKLKLPHHRLHDMRHMTASELGRLNISAGIAKLILGHSSELMSLYYTHLSTSSTGEPLELIAEGLRKDLPDTIH
ncbi:phage integrase family protein [Leucobacter luti]|uniref:Phage integrase family protein n=1 Tax=Leucobacter luti TaxID=340320 RepID=A0A4R6RU40_9MICO|nr:hypothetical protein [Leucobacter luti]TDP89785.1 phage integrase family protein [Leucobacter luti]